MFTATLILAFGKPVKLVKTVVVRKIVVAPSNRFLMSRPYNTSNPEPMPTRLITTCTSVNVDRDMPRIMATILSGENVTSAADKLQAGLDER